MQNGEHSFKIATAGCRSSHLVADRTFVGFSGTAVASKQAMYVVNSTRSFCSPQPSVFPASYFLNV